MELPRSERQRRRRPVGDLTIRRGIPGRIRFRLRGDGRTTTLAADDDRLTLRLAFGAAPGQCGERRFAAASAPRPHCRFGAGAHTPVCR